MYQLNVKKANNTFEICQPFLSRRKCMANANKIRIAVSIYVR